MQFLNPTYLWALLGLAVPIAIHLWSKKQGKTIKVGSIRFLKTSDTQKSKSIQLNELLLLFLRLFIITLLIFIIAEPAWKSKTEQIALIYIVEPSLLNSPEIKSLAEKWSDSAEVRLLHSGFPKYDAEIEDYSSSKAPYYWQLAKEMQNLPTDSIVVLTHSFQKGYRGKRPKIGKPIKWIVKDLSQKEGHMIGKIEKNEEIELISLISDAEYLKFEKEMQSKSSVEKDSISISKRDTVNVYVYAEPMFKADAHYLKASFRALKAYADYPIQLKSIESKTEINERQNDVLVWLSESEMPAFDGKTIQYQPDLFAKNLLIQANPTENYNLTKRLNSENSIEGHLAEQLLDMLDLYPEIRTRAKTYDKRVMPKAMAKPQFDQAISIDQSEVMKASTTYLWLILILLLVTERLVARLRKQ